jgi:hypothetical protein
MRRRARLLAALVLALAVQLSARVLGGDGCPGAWVELEAELARVDRALKHVVFPAAKLGT